MSHTSQLFTEFVSKSGYDPKNIPGVSNDDIILVEGIIESRIFIYVYDFQEGENV